MIWCGGEKILVFLVGLKWLLMLPLVHSGQDTARSAVYVGRGRIAGQKHHIPWRCRHLRPWISARVYTPAISSVASNGILALALGTNKYLAVGYDSATAGKLALIAFDGTNSHSTSRRKQERLS